MSFDCKQFRSLVERTLDDIGMNSPAAVSLLLGTAAQESRFGTYIRQLNGGPARGIFQMERPTFDWLHRKFSPVMEEVFCRKFEELEWDIRFAIIMARLRYKVIPSPLPASTDIPGLAQYWKDFYNTAAGKGTIWEFIENYNKYVNV